MAVAFGALLLEFMAARWAVNQLEPHTIGWPPNHDDLKVEIDRKIRAFERLREKLAEVAKEHVRPT